MPQYFIELNGSDITALYRDDVKVAPVTAIPITEEQGEILRNCSNFGEYEFINETLIKRIHPLFSDFKKAHNNYLNFKAKERNYDSIHTAALRAAYPGPYHDEGLAYAQWMDACNVLGYQILAEVQAGTRQAPATIEEYISLLPVLVLP